MAEPRRIDDNEILTPAPDVTERRMPSRDLDTRSRLLRDEPVAEPQTAPATRVSDETSIPLPSSTVKPGIHEPFGRSQATTVRSDATIAPDQPTMLFAESEVGDFRSRWSSIQTAFVDEPRQAVEDADHLVKSVLKRLSDGFTNERDRLAKEWDRGDDVSTEDLRVALQRYRSFFDRLLHI